jgi:hypothetical protein
MNKIICSLCLSVFLCCLIPSAAWSRPGASVKFSTIREDNPRLAEETLILPYAFPSDSMGTTFGVGGLAKGFFQDQLLFAGTVFGSVDEAKGIIGGMWDYKLPFSKRLYFSAYGAFSHFPRQRAYIEVPRLSSAVNPSVAGANDSDEDNYIEDEGDDNWYELKLEYVLPLGSMKDKERAQYRLKKGILQSGATGGDTWNPLETGVSVLLLGQSGRYQNYETDEVTYSGDTFPWSFGYLYNNTDFPTNPSYGSLQYIAYSKDFSDGNTGPWDFLEFEASKFWNLGKSRFSRQQVIALNFWTGNSLSWDETTDAKGDVIVENKPPFLEGAKLGGFYRLKGFPNNRFNDRAVIYGSAEYRYTLDWNPVAGVNWLRWLKLDWFQLVPFIEVGRVAPDYDLGELFSDLKYDAGLGIRALTAGAVVRFDMAASEEGTNFWVMFQQPF